MFNLTSFGSIGRVLHVTTQRFFRVPWYTKLTGFIKCAAILFKCMAILLLHTYWVEASRNKKTTLMAVNLCLDLIDDWSTSFAKIKQLPLKSDKIFISGLKTIVGIAYLSCILMFYFNSLKDEKATEEEKKHKDFVANFCSTIVMASMPLTRSLLDYFLEALGSFNEEQRGEQQIGRQEEHQGLTNRIENSGQDGIRRRSIPQI